MNTRLRQGTRISAHAIVAALLLATPVAVADTPTPALRQLNLWIVDRHIVPRYAVLVDASMILQANTAKFCSRPDAHGLALVRKAFHKTADAWAGVQHLRFGPGEVESRAYRIELWPDRRNAVSRHLADLLKDRDNTNLATVRFQSASVAVQGLPAMERLLFEADMWERLIDGSEPGEHYCAVLHAIAQNLHAIAVAIHNEWTAGQHPFRRIIATAGNGNVRYFDDQEATLDLFKSLHGGLSLIADIKLERMLDANTAKVGVRRAEAWRSGRTMRNIRLNLAALQELYQDDGNGAFDDYLRTVAGDEALATEIGNGFTIARSHAEAVPDDIATVLQTPTGRAQLEELQQNVISLRELVAHRLSVALNIPVGFNALDGD